MTDPVVDYQTLIEWLQVAVEQAATATVPLTSTQMRWADFGPVLQAIQAIHLDRIATALEKLRAQEAASIA